MRNNLKPILMALILCGFWGIFAYLVRGFILVRFPITSLLFFPFLFGGIAAIISMIIEKRIPFGRALLVGFISGFVYQLLFLIFPFFASILAGASLGGGLVAGDGKLGDILDRLLSVLKGVFLFPFFIYFGSFILSFINLFGSDFLLWFFWGGWVGLVIFLITMPIFKRDHTERDFQTFSEVDEFKSEAQQILSELNQLDSRFS